jgi:hypothetical protein
MSPQSEKPEHPNSSAAFAMRDHRSSPVMGSGAVVMLAVEQYDQLVARTRQPRTLVEFFRKSPLVGLDLDFDRDKDTGGEIEL